MVNWKNFFELAMVPIIAGLLAEIIKSTIDAAKGEFEWRKLIHSYGGMPSVHTALVSAITTQVALKAGIDSVAFGISVIFSILIIRDALGFRMYLGDHGKVLNILIKEQKIDTPLLPRLEERLGHTIPQVLIGAILGAVVVILFDLWI